MERPDSGRRVLVQDEADPMGQLLALVLEAGLELKSSGSPLSASGYDRLVKALDGLEPSVLGVAEFRSGLDVVITGLRNANAPKVADGFSLLADYLLSERRGDAALIFGRAAVFLDEESAVCSWKLARLKRKSGHWDAVAWYSRAIALGEKNGTWEPVIRSRLGLAQAAFELERYPAALRLSERALRTARDHQVWHVVPEALHYLAVLCFHLGQPARGLVHAREALSEYGDNWPRIAMLANNIASYVYNDTGQFERALPLFRAALHEVTDPYDKLHVMASYARAAGGARRIDEFEWAKKEMYRLAPLVPEKQGIVVAFRDLARGALNLGLLDDAERAVAMVCEAAEHREMEDASGIVPIADELKALKKSIVKKPDKRRVADLEPLEDELSGQIIEMLESTKMDGLVQELVSDTRKSDAKTALVIDCDASDVATLEKLVAVAGGAIHAKVPTLKGASIYVYDLPVAKVSSIVGSPAAQFVTVPEEYTLVD